MPSPGRGRQHARHRSGGHTAATRRIQRPATDRDPRVGSDARPGQNPLASRADSIHAIFLHPRKQRAVVVGIPRDSFVSIPGLGTTKINAAMSSGGPRMVQTIEQNFGARIDYWAVTSFWGITRMVETIGGLQVRVPFRMKAASRSRTSARDSAPPWAAGPGVRPRSTQRARRGLRPPGERGRVRGGARAVQEGIRKNPPAPHGSRRACGTRNPTSPWTSSWTSRSGRAWIASRT